MLRCAVSSCFPAMRARRASGVIPVQGPSYHMQCLLCCTSLLCGPASWTQRFWQSQWPSLSKQLIWSGSGVSAICKLSRIIVNSSFESSQAATFVSAAKHWQCVCRHPWADSIASGACLRLPDLTREVEEVLWQCSATWRMAFFCFVSLQA